MTVEDPGSSVRFVAVEVVQMVALLPVIVQVPLPIFRVRVPVPEQLNVDIVGLLLFVAKSKVPVKAPIVIDTTLRFVLTVTVPPPELASKVTVSATPGTDWPPAPFEVAAQCVVSEASQVPAPPTQKRFAIYYFSIRITVALAACSITETCVTPCGMK